MILFVHKHRTEKLDVQEIFVILMYNGYYHCACALGQVAGVHVPYQYYMPSSALVICQELVEKHEEVYSAEQRRAWVHLLQMHKHDSYDEPPNKPFFRNGCSRKGKYLATAGASTVTISPGEHVAMQGQLIEQISRT